LLLPLPEEAAAVGSELSHSLDLRRLVLRLLRLLGEVPAECSAGLRERAVRARDQREAFELPRVVRETVEQPERPRARDSRVERVPKAGSREARRLREARVAHREVSPVERLRRIDP